MFVDTQETFADAQSVASAAGDVVSTNIYDTGAAADVGIGERMYLYAKMNAALVGAGASIQVVLQTSASSGSGYTDAVAGAVVPVASATANSVLARLALPIGLQRYLRVVFRISGATTTAGTATAILAKDVPAQQYLTSGTAF
ncbi:hypothetical protein D3C72_1586220 [compost metagenome]